MQLNLFSGRTSTGVQKTLTSLNKINLVVSYKHITFTSQSNTHNMTKFQSKVQSVGIILMSVFPICVILTMLVSDYRTEEEFNQYQVISQFLVNWYTFTMLLVGMLFYSIGWFKFPPNKKRPTTF